MSRQRAHQILERFSNEPTAFRLRRDNMKFSGMTQASLTAHLDCGPSGILEVEILLGFKDQQLCRGTDFDTPSYL